MFRLRSTGQVLSGQVLHPSAWQSQRSNPTEPDLASWLLLPILRFWILVSIVINYKQFVNYLFLFNIFPIKRVYQTHIPDKVLTCCYIGLNYFIYERWDRKWDFSVCQCQYGRKVKPILFVRSPSDKSGYRLKMYWATRRLSTRSPTNSSLW